MEGSKNSARNPVTEDARKGTDQFLVTKGSTSKWAYENCEANELRESFFCLGLDGNFWPP
jgi:hypothetical protein